MTSVNTALEVDLFGQANASRIGARIHSGFGGQTDFIVGALHSHGGRAITALRSRHPKADVSTIVPMVDEPVTSFKASAIVTEQGGTAVRAQREGPGPRPHEQAAHPRVRAELWEEAHHLGLAWADPLSAARTAYPLPGDPTVALHLWALRSGMGWPPRARQGGCGGPGPVRDLSARPLDWTDRLAEHREDNTDVSALKVELVAADRKVWEGEASMVSARSIDGELGILPGHTPLLGVLVTGDVRIATGGGNETVTIDSGFLSVDHDRVVIVADNVDAAGLTSTPTV